ncbi:hypothetical protein A6A04_13725 [Paramagnetospirillum marisnigri]|uniref:Uncharacterized protein n=1 Tax=Paramagnetospirillum marisnigri TaxID=1285242 RepID=A0A178MUR6_9PROT|nr:hypothetical protein [Paramagnetospirillum marisnigri]OAN53944.1 hypothetical protein A6A04_13725 [Paramagnetospirillum marisnigri]
MGLRLVVLAAATVLLTQAGAAEAGPKPDNLCLTCPRPEPACWMVVYRWQDYNLKADYGTIVVTTAGPPPDEQDKERARQRILRTLPPNHTVAITKSSRIACPPGARVE